MLTPPTQPEVQAFRRWLCRQVLAPGRREPARALGGARTSADAARSTPPGWDAASWPRADQGLIAANDASQIIAVSPEAARAPGLRRRRDLVGAAASSRSCPERYRQAHVAGFTMFLLVGRQPLLDTPVVVPALRRDGSEVEIELLVRDTGLARAVRSCSPTSGSRDV